MRENDDYFPLFAALPRERADCASCLDTGLFRFSNGEVGPCPRRRFCRAQLTETTIQLFRAVYERQARRLWIDPLAFDVARILTHYSKENPLKRERLEKIFFSEHPEAETGDNERKIKDLIETLRKNWLLPVGSLKRPPYGHWIITTAAELEEWRREASSAPLTQLATIYRVVRFNAPQFAGQTDFEFAELAGEIEAKIREMEATA